MYLKSNLRSLVHPSLLRCPIRPGPGAHHSQPTPKGDIRRGVSPGKFPHLLTTLFIPFFPSIHGELHIPSASKENYVKAIKKYVYETIPTHIIQAMNAVSASKHADACQTQ